jgi:signal transduction histidine kinase
MIMTMGIDGLKCGIQDEDIKMIRKAGDLLQEGSQRISDLVTDMVTYAKKRLPELTLVDLNSMLDDIAVMMKPACNEKGITIGRDFDPELGRVLIDKNGIHRCIMNFISNAMDAASNKPEGRITLRTKLDRKAGEVEVQIEDNGSGIPEDKLDKIFDVFFSTKKSKGTGLGLATTKKIIHEHGGTVNVQSTVGEGTTFFLHLPR